MVWDVDAYEILFYVEAVAYAWLAGVVLRARPDRAQNRWLAGLLVVESLLTVTSPTISITDQAPVAYAAAVAWTAAFVLAIPVYIGFLGTLHSRFSRTLRTRAWRWTPWVLPAAGLTLLLVRPATLVVPPDATSLDPWATMGGPLLPGYQLAYLATMLLGLAAAIAYWRQSPPGTMARRQGRLFALAFGIHDGGLFLVMGTYFASTIMGASNLAAWIGAYYGLPILKAAFLALLCYGILRAQLFDLDLKVKWTLSRATAVALLAVAFSGVKEALEYFLPGEGLIANLAGAAAVGVVAWPAARLGRALANRVLPHVQADGAFLSGRRLDVFRASLESIAYDGAITARERRVLETMRKELGIPDLDAQRLEREVLGASAGALGEAPAPA